MKRIQKEIPGTVHILGAGILWGTVGLFIRQLSDSGAAPEFISFLRVIFAAGIMTIFGLIRNGYKCFIVSKRTLVACALLGFVCHGIYNVLRSAAVIYVGVGVSTVLQNIAPVVTLLCSSRIFGEHISAKKCISVILCILGCTLTAANNGMSMTSHFLVGILFSTGAGACYGLTAIFSRLTDEKDDPITVSIYSYLFATLFLGIWIHPWQGLAVINKELIMWSFLYALIPTALAYLLYHHGVHLIRETGKVPVLASSETIVAVLLGSLIYHERLDIIRVLGISLVLGGIAIMSSKRKKIFPVQA